MFFFNDTATTEIYTLSLHDALPISLLPVAHGAFGSPAELPRGTAEVAGRAVGPGRDLEQPAPGLDRDRKSTRLNSSHANISYAVFCLKKKKHTQQNQIVHATSPKIH